MTAELAALDADVLSADSPPLDAGWVRALAQTRYALTGEMTALSGERDRNYRITSADDGARYMLKLSHPAESALVADFQTRALMHIERVDPGLPVQRIVPTLDGEPSFTADPGERGEGAPRVVRLFSYLPGLPLPEAPRSVQQRVRIARTLARLDLALRDFTHPAGALELPWDIQRADSVRGLLAHINDPERRWLAGRALDRFERIAKPALPALRRQPIHNDFNIYNLLVDPADPDRIAGVLDFGDMVHAPLIDDLAVAAAYQLDAEQDDPMTELAPFVAAYHAVLPLQRAEVDLLFALMSARLAMVVAISGWRAARQPDNAAYLLRNNAVSWARLAACERIGDAAATLTFRCACGFA